MSDDIDIEALLADYPAEDIELAADAELCERDLAWFYRQSWNTIDPDPYQHNWHIDALSDHLMAVTDGEIRKLLINLPPRHGKPVAHDALVLTQDRGFVPLREIVIGDMVQTHRGRWRKVLDKIDQGELDVVRLSLWSGRQVDLTADHRVFTTEGWVEAGKLNGSDVAGVVPCRDECGSPSISLEEARLLGYLVGDGTCKGTPNITCGDDAEAQDIIHCIRSVGFEPTDQKYALTKTGKTLRRISIRAGYYEARRPLKGYIGPVKRWLDSHGILGKSSYTKMVPRAIMTGSNAVVAAFIGAYWSCDGHISLRGAGRQRAGAIDLALGCDSVNKYFIQQMQILLGRLGIYCRMREKTGKIKTKRQGDLYKSYSIAITTQDDCWRFASQIKFFHEKYGRFSEANKRRFDFDRNIWGDPVVSVGVAGRKHCYCLRVEEDSSFTANGIAVHNTNVVSIAWQAWTWAQKKIGPRSGPQVSFLTLTYASKLALDNAVKARRMIASEWYQARWGKHYQIAKDMDSAERFGTTAGGIRFSTGFDGSTLGRGGIIKIIDDPIKIDDAESETIREHVLTTYKESLQSRVTDPREAAEVIIMQRVHERDLSGFVLEQGGWEHLMLPGLYDPSRHCVTSIGWSDPRGTDKDTGGQYYGLDDDGNVIPGSPLEECQDEPLWADRWGRAELEGLNLGPYAWAGQIQQMPAPRGGGIIRRDWWRPWRDPQFPSFGTVVASLDTALKEKETNDYNALTIWGAFPGDKGHPQFMLIDAWRGRCSLATLVETVAKMCRKRKADYLLIEDKTRGHDVAAELQRSIRGNSWSTRLLNPKGDKVSRCNSVAHLWSGDFRIDPDTRIESFSGGIIWAPVGEGAEYDWVEPVISEFENFPQGKNDDWVDSGVQAISWMRTNGVALRKVEYDEEELMKKQFKKPSRPVYDV